MKGILYLVIGLLLTCTLQAQMCSGVYHFNKGINKEQGSVYVNHFKRDSAFFYLTYMSGDPDFNTFNLKGFISITEGVGLYRKGDSIQLHFNFVASNLIIKNDSLFGLEKGILTKYKKASASLKKNSTIYIDFVEKLAKAKTDSVWAYEVPDVESNTVCLLGKNDEIKVIDSYGYFYLIETPKKNKEFLWVLKKNLSLSKN